MVEIKKKNLDRREWYSDKDRDFACRYHKDDFFEGGIGLVTFTGIAGPDEVDAPSGRLCIADKGYQWVELAPKGGNYVITSMIHGDEIFQHYIDITLRNEIADNGDTVFYDLLLDVVIAQDGTPAIIDTEELDEALDTGIISQDDYDLAKKTAKDIADYFAGNKKQIEDKLIEYRKLLTT